MAPKSIRFRDKTQSKRNRCVMAFKKGGGSELDKEHRRQNTDDDDEIDRPRANARRSGENHKLKNNFLL